MFKFNLGDCNINIDSIKNFCINNLRSDIIKYDDRIEVLVEVCGLTKDDISISVEDNLVIVETKEEENDTRNYIQKERNVTGSKRKFRIINDVDYDLISATVVNGLLTIKLPLKEKTKKTIIIE